MFRLFARPEEKILPVVQILCPQCGCYFCVCRKCWRGQKYCGRECKQEGYIKIRKKAKKEYQNSENGKRKRRESEARRRWRLMAGKKKKTTLTSKLKPGFPPSSVKGKGINPDQQLTNKPCKKEGVAGVCCLCGCVGVIVKKISGKLETTCGFFSFRRCHWQRNKHKGEGGKKNVLEGVQLYWRRK